MINRILLAVGSKRIGAIVGPLPTSDAGWNRVEKADSSFALNSAEVDLGVYVGKHAGAMPLHEQVFLDGVFLGWGCPQVSDGWIVSVP